jgi:hypothetical protein
MDFDTFISRLGMNVTQLVYNMKGKTGEALDQSRASDF